jgi:DNA repair exonuclease SbcCD nuclease subunit
MTKMGSVSVLAIGDPHFKVGNGADCQLLTDKIQILVENAKPDFVVVMGDVLDTHEKVSVFPLNLLIKFFKMLSERVPTYVLVGNHDLIGNTQFLTEHHCLNSFKEWKNLTICDNVKTLELKGQKFVFVPYVPNERFLDALETLRPQGKTWTDASCIFAHQEFYGCRFNPVQVSTEGDLWSDDKPLVVSGHIHNEQRLQPNLYYVGSSLQHGFSENADKIIALLSFSKGQPFGLQRIDLQLPKKKIFYLDVENADLFVVPPETQTKVVIKGRPEQIRVFRRGDAFKKLVKAGAKVTFSPKIEVALRKGGTTKQSVIEILHGMVKEASPEVQRAYEVLTTTG